MVWDFITKHTNSHIIKYNWYLTIFIGIAFINILISIFISLEYPTETFGSLKRFALVCPRFLISNWYFGSYESSTDRYILSVSDWGFIRFSKTKWLIFYMNDLQFEAIQAVQFSIFCYYTFKINRYLYLIYIFRLSVFPFFLIFC